MTLDVALRHAFPSLALDVAFSAPAPGVTALFGPSGAGKSTVIAVVAGLLRPNWARIALPGAVLADTAEGIWTPPERRRVGLVFQDARLFPHMTVLGNLRYGQRRAPPGPILLDDVVGLLGIGGLLARRPLNLSGGERSHVAIGPCLAGPTTLAAHGRAASCAVPECGGAYSILTRQEEDTLWQQVFTAQPARRREFEPSSKRRKRRLAPLPPNTGSTSRPS